MRLIAGYGAIASALPYLALKLVWLGGGTLGVADQVMMRETSMVVLNAVTAGMGLPVAMTWIGAGSMFGWGLWQTINVVGQTALLRSAEGMAFVNLIGLLRLIVGLVMGLLLVFVLAERHALLTTTPDKR